MKTHKEIIEELKLDGFGFNQNAEKLALDIDWIILALQIQEQDFKKEINRIIEYERDCK